MLGAKVRAAFDASDLAEFEARDADDGTTLLALPHPSGRCRIWNQPDAVERARAAIRATRIPSWFLDAIGGAE